MNTSNIITSLKYNYLIIKNRLKTDSPVFFVKLKGIALKVAGSAVAVITVNSTLTLGLPVALITALGYLVAVCVAIAGTSQLTKV